MCFDFDRFISKNFGFGNPSLNDAMIALNLRFYAAMDEMDFDHECLLDKIPFTQDPYALIELLHEDEGFKMVVAIHYDEDTITREPLSFLPLKSAEEAIACAQHYLTSHLALGICYSKVMEYFVNGKGEIDFNIYDDCNLDSFTAITPEYIEANHQRVRDAMTTIREAYYGCYPAHNIGKTFIKGENVGTTNNPGYAYNFYLNDKCILFASSVEELENKIADFSMNPDRFKDFFNEI